jgi:class 3 adenylate cyclase
MSSAEHDFFEWDAAMSQRAPSVASAESSAKMSASFTSAGDVEEVDNAELDIISRPTKRTVTKVLTTAIKTGALTYDRFRQIISERIEEIMDIDGVCYDASVMPSIIPLVPQDEGVTIDNETPLTVFECKLCIAMILTKLQVERQQAYDARMTALEQSYAVRPEAVPDSSVELAALHSRPARVVSSLREVALDRDAYWKGLPSLSEPMRGAMVSTIAALMVSFVLSLVMSATVASSLSECREASSSAIAQLTEAHHAVLEQTSAGQQIAVAAAVGNVIPKVFDSVFYSPEAVSVRRIPTVFASLSLARNYFRSEDERLAALLTAQASLEADMVNLGPGLSTAIASTICASVNTTCRRDGQYTTCSAPINSTASVCVTGTLLLAPSATLWSTQFDVTCLWQTGTLPPRAELLAVARETLPNVTADMLGAFAIDAQWQNTSHFGVGVAVEYRGYRFTLATVERKTTIEERRKASLAALDVAAPFDMMLWESDAIGQRLVQSYPAGAKRISTPCALKAAIAGNCIDSSMGTLTAFAKVESLGRAVSVTIGRPYHCGTPEISRSAAWLSAVTSVDVHTRQFLDSVEPHARISDWIGSRAWYRQESVHGGVMVDGETYHVSSVPSQICNAVFTVVQAAYPGVGMLSWLPTLVALIIVLSWGVVTAAVGSNWITEQMRSDHTITDNDDFRVIIAEFTAGRIPPQIAASATVPFLRRLDSLIFVFADPVGSLVAAEASAPNYVRLIAYTFKVLDLTATHFGLTKVKTVGDGYFVVAGLPQSHDMDEAGDDELAEEGGSAALRALAFAGVTQMLTSAAYRHYPNRHPEFAELKSSDTFFFLPLRFGIHCGPANVGVVDVRCSAPDWDCYGPNVSIARRLEEVCPAGRILISTVVRRQVQAADRRRRFDFESSVKKLLKGIGTISTSLVASTKVRVPSSLAQQTLLDEAVRRRFFSNSGWRDQGEHDDNSMTSHSIMGESVIASETGSVAGDDMSVADSGNGDGFMDSGAAPFSMAHQLSLHLAMLGEAEQL